MLADTTTSLTVVAAGAGLLLSITALLAGVFFSAKSKGQQQSIEALSVTNESMETALRFEREERERDNAKCAQELAHLRGQVDAMQKQQVDALMNRIGESMNTLVSATLDRMEDGLHVAVTAAVEKGVEAGVRAAKRNE